MKIIADAGSTKTDWVLIGNDREEAMRVSTRGFNAAQADPEELTALIASEAPGLIEAAGGVEEVWFYGAGCTPERIQGVEATLDRAFQTCGSRAASDMLGAARALCGRQAGIACILGTGANSCLFDGSEIISNTPALGFILGDEGSGAVLGRLLIAAVFKGTVSPQVRILFEEEYPGLTSAEVIHRVYRKERPGAWLASFAPFLSRHSDIEELDRLVTDEFLRFLQNNIRPYLAVPQTDIHIAAATDCHPAAPLEIHFTGSIAVNFGRQLREAIDRFNRGLPDGSGLTLGRIVKAPIEGLIEYHSRT